MDFAVMPARTALVNVDLQNTFVDRTEGSAALVARVNALAAACRSAGILVIHTRHVVRPDGANWGVLAEIPNIRNGVLNEGAKSAELHPDLAVDDRDVILNKPRFGAFTGTDLELILRSRGIDTVVIAGISTNICCDTTTREAHARDFRVLFLSDGTMTPAGPSIQQVTLETLDGIFAQVLSIDELMQKLAAADGRSEAG